jgi:hypothetical protein
MNRSDHGQQEPRYAVRRTICPMRRPHKGWWWEIRIDGVTYDYGRSRDYASAARALIRASTSLVTEGDYQ